MGTVGEIRQPEVKEDVHLWQVLIFLLQLGYGARYCSHRVRDNYHVKIGKMRLLYSYHVKLNFLGAMANVMKRVKALQCGGDGEGDVLLMNSEVRILCILYSYLNKYSRSLNMLAMGLTER